jgi:peptidoglycan hydrolase CwlO-like protein
MMNNLEDQQIKGLSYRTFISILVSTIITVSSVVGVYYSLRGDIKDINLQKSADDRYRDLQMQTLQTTINSLQVQVENVRNQVNQNSKQIKEESATHLAR